MGVVVTASMDEKQTVAALDRMGNKATEVGKKFAKTGQQSAEGLGFITSALGRLSPGLSFVGEATTKQLPTIIQYGDQLKQWGLVGGAIAATGAAIATIAAEMGKARKETIQAGSAGESFMEFLENVSNFKSVDIPFFGRLQVISRNDPVGMALGMVHRWVTGVQEATERERKEIERLAKMQYEADQQGARARQIELAANAAVHQEAVEAMTDKLTSVEQINAELKRQVDLTASLMTLDGRGKLTEEEAAKIMATQNALLAKRAEMQKQGREFDKVMAQQDASIAFAKELDVAVNSQWETHAKIAKLMAEERDLDRIGLLTTEKRVDIENQISQVKQKQADIDKAARDAAKADKESRRQQAEEITMGTLSDPTKQRDELLVAKEIAKIRDMMASKQREFDQLLSSDLRNTEEIARQEQEIVALRNKETSLLIEHKNVRLQELAAVREMRAEEEAARRERRAGVESERRELIRNWAGMIRGGGGQPVQVAGGGGFGPPAAGGGVGAGGGQQAAGPQGWQPWGGPVRMGLQPFWQGGPGGQNDGSGQGGGGDFDTNPAAPNARMQRKARAAARNVFLEQVDAIRRAFDEEMAGADKLEKQGIDVGDQRKDIARRRNQKMAQAKADRGDNEQEELVGLQKDARDKQVDAAAKRQKLNADMVDVLKQVVADNDMEAKDIAALQKDVDIIKAAVGVVNKNRRNPAQR